MPRDEVGDLVSRGYDHVADEYAALESAAEPWPRLARVRAFIADLPDGSRMLDLGCGNGLPATREIADTHTATGVDISPEQIARAKSNVPEATLHCADVREIEFAPRSFDAIVALYLIDNVPVRDYPALFRKIAGWLEPGGRILLSAEPGGDPGQVYEMFLNTIPVSELVATLEAASLHVVELETESQNEGGRDIEFVWLIAEASR